MKTLVKYLFSLVVLTFLLVACGSRSEKKSQTADESEGMAMEVMPELIFENDYAKVLKIILEPGKAISSHQEEARVIYSLTDYSIDWEENGKSEDGKSWIKGDVHFHEAGIHSAKNNGTTTAEWMVFARKNTELPECGENTIENDVNSVSPEFTNVLLDNDDFKITEVSLLKGESIPMHSGINRIIYSLTDYQLIYESKTERNGEKEFQAGDVHWHEACQHALQNNGETEAKFLVISYKQKEQ
jgi:quercetin dioxygenase-like cupin family protein